MSDNPVQDWIDSDDRLRSIIEELSYSGKSEEQQAEEGFEIICNEYNLPKYPDSFTDEDYERFDELDIDTPRSVYEEAAIIRYLEPDDDPRGIILLAMYNVKNRLEIDINECAARHFGGPEKIPKQYMVYFLGKGAHGTLSFLTEGKSWTETGARYACQIIRRNPDGSL